MVSNPESATLSNAPQRYHTDTAKQQQQQQKTLLDGNEWFNNNLFFIQLL